MWRVILPLRTVLAWEPLAAARGVSQVARSSRGFLRALEAAGSFSRLPDHWKTAQKNFVARHQAQILASGDRWLDPGDLPTRQALAVLIWAYWPDRHREQLRRATAARRAWLQGGRSNINPNQNPKTLSRLILSRVKADR